jgi:hypothetical protein
MLCLVAISLFFIFIFSMPKKSIGSLELMNNFLGLLQWQLEVVVDLDNPKSNWTNFLFLFYLSTCIIIIGSKNRLKLKIKLIE